MTNTKTAETTSPAQKAWHAATKATEAAADAIQPARDNLAAAREALQAAESEAFEAITVKSADPAAARERIENARAAIKQSEDDVTWAVLQLHAAEAVHEQAHTDEQTARRRVTVAEYEAAHREFNDPDSRENVLLAQLADTVAELITLINDRKDKHDRLAQEFQYLPPEERPQLPAGSPIMPTPTRLIGEHIANLTREVADAIKAGTATAEIETKAKTQAAQQDRLAKAAG